MKKRSRRLTVVDRLLSSGQTAVFVLNARRQVVFFNEGCEKLTGWSSADVLGTKCAFATEPDPAQIESVSGSLCPPPEVFEGKTASIPAFFAHRDGTSASRVIHFFPILNAEGAVGSVLGIVSTAPAPKSVAGVSLAQQLHAELAAQRAVLRQRFGLKSIVARGAAMLRVLRQVHLARVSTATVLLRGEAGSGKEHIARVIHNESEGRSRAFVPLDCARLPSFELKSALRRLFGTETDSKHEPASPLPLQAGTVLLANVDVLPRDLQQFVLDTMVTGNAAKPVRMMASATLDLRGAVERDTFLEDLADALSTIVIELPALRHRRDDLPLLAQAILEDQNRSAERQIGGLADEVLRQFQEYNWPGNLDELSDVVREAHAAAGGNVVVAADLPFRFRSGMEAQLSGPAAAPREMPLEQYLEAIEKTQIEQALEQVRFNKSRAAELLGMPRPKLYRRMEALGIHDREPDATS